jgi:transcriptional regulator of arginine metabolism
MSATASRRRLIRSLLADHVVGSQVELVALLADHGHDITQATASRDLQAIGAVKNGAGYAITGERHAEAASLAHALAEFAESIVPSANLVVIHTPPGAAQMLAAALDAAAVDGVVGTVAGDDTILVVAEDALGGVSLAARLEQTGT